MKHISKNEFTDLLLGLADEKKRNSAAEHMAICKECSLLYKKMLPVLTPYIKDKVLVPDKLKKRILRSAILLREKTTNFSLRDYLFQIFRKHANLYISIASSFVIIAIMGGILFFEYASGSVYYKVSKVYGKAKINAARARVNDPVTSGNSISIDENSSMLLSISKDYKLILIGETYLTIDKAKLSANRGLEVKYTLDKGTLLSRHNQKDKPVSYAFKTPNALINAKDAELMIHTKNNESSIFLIKGKIEVHGKNFKKKTTIDSPGKYIISDGNSITKDEDTDIDDLQSIDEALKIPDDDETLVNNNHFNPNQTSDDPVKDSENERLVNKVTNIISESSESDEIGTSQQ